MFAKMEGSLKKEGNHLTTEQNQIPRGRLNLRDNFMPPPAEEGVLSSTALPSLHPGLKDSGDRELRHFGGALTVSNCSVTAVTDKHSTQLLPSARHQCCVSLRTALEG